MLIFNFIHSIVISYFNHKFMSGNNKRSSLNNIEEKTKPPNQKKECSLSSSSSEDEAPKKHKLFKQDLYLNNSYMRTFIKKNSEDTVKCLKCSEDLKVRLGVSL